MAYSPLNDKTVIDYVKGLQAIQEIFPKNGQIVAKEVGDGNLNQIFIVHAKENPQKGVVVKQSLPYLRVAGESWPLTLERVFFETESLILYNKLCPGLVPKVFHHDYDMYLFVMEYLGDHEIMRKPLVRRVRFPLFLDHITTFLAQSLFFTSDLYLTGAEKKELQKKFINPHLCKIQEDFVYTNPYMDSSENKWNPLVDRQVKEVRNNGPLKIKIARLKEHYMAHGQALIHSDLHTGSIMINQKDTRVIDSEFAFFGPMAYDVAAVIQNLALNYLSHFAHTPEVEERVEFQSYLLALMRGVWTEFARKFEDLWIHNNRGDLVPDKYWDFQGGKEAFTEFRRQYMADLFTEMVGIGGTKLLRRMMGIVTVWDISSIPDPANRAVAERIAIRLGTRWVLEAENIHTIDEMLAVLVDESKEVKI